MLFLRTLTIGLLLLGLVSASAQGEVTHLDLTFPQTSGYSMHGFAETSPGNVIAVGLAATVLRSEDWGSTWTQIQAPTMSAPDFYDVATFSGGNLVAVGQAPGIFLSQDGGFTWSTPDLPVGSLFREVSLKPNGDISAAGENGIILVSDDQGLTWQDVGPGNSLVRDQLWLTDENCFTISNDGIQRTTDGGITWEVVQETPFHHFEEVFQVSGSHLVALGAFKRYDSLDNGSTWSPSELPIPNYPRNSVVLDSLHWIVTEFNEGAEIHETFDAGETWNLRLFQTAVGMTNILSLSNGRKLASSSDGLIFWSDDNFATYNSAWESLIYDRPNTTIRNLAQRADGVLFASGSTSFAPVITSWLRSDNQGESWQILEGGPGSFTTQLEFGPGNLALSTNNRNIWFSQDGGLNWAQATTIPGLTKVDLATATDDHCFASVNHQTGGSLLESTDQGASWTTVQGSWDEGSLYYGQVDFLDADTGWVTAQATGDNVLFRTIDGGSSWQQIDQAGLGGRPSCMLWTSLDEGFVGVQNGTNTSGLYRTEDGGQHWERLTTNRTTRVNLGREGEILAFGLTDADDTMSSDDGLTWGPMQNPFRTAFNEGSSHAVASLFLGDRWLMGGKSAQIFNLRLDAPAPVEIDRLPTWRNGLITASPNPFNPSTTVRMSIPPSLGLVTLEIFDARGAKIRLLWQGIPTTPNLEVFWDGHDNSGSQVSSGLYFARLAGQDFQAFGKMMLVK